VDCFEMKVTDQNDDAGRLACYDKLVADMPDILIENPQGPQFRIWVTSNIMSSYYRTNYISTQVARLVFPNLASA